MNEKYKFGNKYHLQKIKEAFFLNYKTFTALFLSCLLLCKENIVFGGIIYIFCIHLTYFVHVLAHNDFCVKINKIHEYHHNHNDFYAHYLQIFLELSSGIMPIMLIYLYTGKPYIKYSFEPYVLFMFSFFYSSIHNVNYSIYHVNKIHSNHHDNWSVNYGPDILDVIYGTKENYEELENTDHYLPNLVISTIGIMSLKFFLNYIGEKYKNIFLTNLIRIYALIISSIYVFNLNLLFNYENNTLTFNKKIQKIIEKIQN
jgi:hypothetical protein